MQAEPDLSSRPFQLAVEREMVASPEQLFRAWTEQIGLWFAAPETVMMKPEINAPFFFATKYEGKLHPHYGRFLELEPSSLIKLTWVTGEGGTNGAETVVTVKLNRAGEGTRLMLSHAGFANEEAKKQHAQAWPLVLEQLDKTVANDA
jgi:uncharacterized protein YndB with AHSA1/START domain